MLADVFELTDRAWRGIGMIPQSGWRLSEKYADFDAEKRFEVTGIHTDESALCRSGEVLQGLIKPHECAAFGKECTPRNPLGATMVSSEGACAAYYLYRRLELVGADRWRKPRRGATISTSTHGCVRRRCATRPTIVMGHGGGGALSAELIEHLFLPAYGSAADAQLGDSAVVDVGGTRLAFSTDSYVVKPMFFPGGSIGDLAVNGTVNDLAMSGATPARAVDGVHPGGGHRLADLGRVAEAVGDAARRAGVKLVTGDTKVVDSGSGDGVFINTAGHRRARGWRRHQARASGRSATSSSSAATSASTGSR